MPGGAPLNTKNLGLIKAIHVGVNPPLNTKILWFNDSNLPYTTGPAKVHYYYSVIAADWLPLAGGGGTGGSYTYIAFASSCDGTQDFSLTLDKDVHCFFAIFISPVEINNPDSSHFENRWSRFCRCGGESGGSNGINTYIAFADDCEGTNFSFDPKYEVECEDCQYADYFEIDSANNSFNITPDGDGITVDVSTGLAGQEAIIDLQFGNIPLQDLIKYCIEISTPLNFTGNFEIDLGDDSVLLNSPKASWKNKLVNSGSKLRIKIPQDQSGQVNASFHIKVGTEECCAYKEGDKCYCDRNCWAVIYSDKSLEELTPEDFENRWIQNCCESQGSNYDGIISVHTQQIEQLYSQFNDYKFITNQKIASLIEDYEELSGQMEECCGRLEGIISGLELTLNNYIESNNNRVGDLEGDLEDLEGRVNVVEDSLEPENLEPLVSPMMDAALQNWLSGDFLIKYTELKEYTDLEVLNLQQQLQQEIIDIQEDVLNIWDFVLTKQIDLKDQQDIEYYVGIEMSVESVEKIYASSGGDTFRIEVNNAPYVLGNAISKGDKIKFSTDGAVVYNIEIKVIPQQQQL